MITISEKIKKLRIFDLKELFLFLIIGISSIGAGTYAMAQNSISPSWPRVDGVVTDIISGDNNKTYAPVVSYIVNNKSYTITSKISNSNMPRINEDKTIAYNPAKPDEAKIDDSSATLFLIIFPIAGIIVIIFSVISFISGSKQKKTIREIIESGKKHPGRITSMCTSALSERTSIFNRKRRPISTITVSTRGNNNIITTYNSLSFIDEIGLSGIDFLETPVYVNVYISATNPRQYYVETNEIISDYITTLANSPTPQSQPNQNKPTAQVNQISSIKNIDAQNCNKNQI